MSARLYFPEPPSAIILYLFASLIGSSAISALLASFGWLLALLGAPFGGSALVLMIAAGVYALRTEREPMV